MRHKIDTLHVIQREVISLATIAEKKLYEGMFLVDSAKAASNWDGINAAIRRILERAGSEIVSMKKWDDRKLAYDIRGVGRGTYILTYFKADGGKIQEIEKAVHLSENIIRVLILSTEQMSKEDIEKDTPAARADKEKQKAAPEQPQDAERDWRDEQAEDYQDEQDQLDDEDEAEEDMDQEDEEPYETEQFEGEEQETDEP
jgi:small subunit ribosomal protein S6